MRLTTKAREVLDQLPRYVAERRTHKMVSRGPQAAHADTGDEPANTSQRPVNAERRRDPAQRGADRQAPEQSALCRTRTYQKPAIAVHEAGSEPKSAYTQSATDRASALTTDDWLMLREVREAWPTLSDADRAAVLAVVRAAVQRTPADRHYEQGSRE